VRVTSTSIKLIPCSPAKSVGREALPGLFETTESCGLRCLNGEKIEDTNISVLLNGQPDEEIRVVRLSDISHERKNFRSQIVYREEAGKL
jgi:hypothetical protein